MTPRAQRLSADNLGVASAAAGGAWGVVSAVAHLPPSLAASVAGAVGALAGAQAIKTKIESRGRRRKGRQGNEGDSR